MDRVLRDKDRRELQFPLVQAQSARSVKLRTVFTIPPARQGESHHFILSLGKDQSLAVASPAENYTHQKFVKSDRVGLRDSAGRIRLFPDTSKARSDGRPRQIYAGDTDARWWVWMETSSVDLYQSNWRLFAREKDGGEPRLIAAAEDQLVESKGYVPLLEGDPIPRLSEGLVWWWTATESPDGSFHPRILAVDPAGGEPREMLPLGGRLAPVKGGVVAVRLRRADGPDAEREFMDTGLVLIDTAGGVRDLIRYSPTWEAEQPWFLTALAADGDIVALSIGETVWVIRTDGTPVARIPVPGDRDVQELAVCGGKVAFAPYSDLSGGDKVMIFDTSTKDLSEIDAPHAQPDVMCTKDRLLWAQILDGRRKTYTIAQW